MSCRTFSVVDIPGPTGAAAEKATKKGNRAMRTDCFILNGCELGLLRTKELEVMMIECLSD
jgi:hypothetical protein